MRAVVQRVSQAMVEVDSKPVGKIEFGLLTLLGVTHGDDEKKTILLIQKIAKLRIFDDENGKMNRSLLDVNGEHLILSQFTLYGDTKQGNRPGFSNAAPAAQAKGLYEKALDISRGLGIKTEAGIFQANMKVSLINDGPVTLLVEV